MITTIQIVNMPHNLCHLSHLGNLCFQILKHFRIVVRFPTKIIFFVIIQNLFFKFISKLCDFVVNVPVVVEVSS